MSTKHSFNKIKQIVEKTGYNCFYCGGNPESVDHVQPKKNGGNDDIRNLVLSCRSCNSSKALSSIKDYGIVITAREIFGLKISNSKYVGWTIEVPIRERLSKQLIAFIQNPKPDPKYDFEKKLKNLWKI